MKTWYLTLTVVILLIAAGVFVSFVGVAPKPIPKFTISQFENSDVVVNSLFLSIAPEIDHSAIFFLGIDPADSEVPLMKEVFEKFWNKAQQSTNPFKAVVVDVGINKFPTLQAEQFDLKKEPERFISGLQTAEKQNLRVLVVVNPMDASPKLPGSLITLARQSVYVRNPDQIAGLVITKFPRQRSEEQAFPISCNTGEADLGQTAGLGCYIIQKSRFSYKKHFTSGMHVGILDQLGLQEFVFLLTREK